MNMLPSLESYSRPCCIYLYAVYLHVLWSCLLYVSLVPHIHKSLQSWAKRVPLQYTSLCPLVSCYLTFSTFLPGLMNLGYTAETPETENKGMALSEGTGHQGVIQGPILAPLFFSLLLIEITCEWEMMSGKVI